MVAYSFQKRFVDGIELGLKSQTIRGERRRHARPGELMQLYAGMRTKQCRLIGTAYCYRVSPVRLDLTVPSVELPWGTIAGDGLDQFAVNDGFRRWGTMATFWRIYHPDVSQFSGVLLEWSGFMPGMRLKP